MTYGYAHVMTHEGMYATVTRTGAPVDAKTGRKRTCRVQCAAAITLRSGHCAERTCVAAVSARHK